MSKYVIVEDGSGKIKDITLLDPEMNYYQQSSDVFIDEHSLLNSNADGFPSIEAARADAEGHMEQHYNRLRA